MWHHLEVDGHSWLPEPIPEASSSVENTSQGWQDEDSQREINYQDAGMGANMSYRGTLDTYASRGAREKIVEEDDDKSSSEDAE